MTKLIPELSRIEAKMSCVATFLFVTINIENYQQLLGFCYRCKQGQLALKVFDGEYVIPSGSKIPH